MSQVVQTSWAVLALMYARYPDKQVIRRGCELIMSRQQAVSPEVFLVMGS